MSPRRWEELEAKMKAEKASGVPAKPAAAEKTLEEVVEESVDPAVEAL